MDADRLDVDGVADLALRELRAEVRRLQDGIREHRDSAPPHAGGPELKLWSLLPDG